MKTPLHKIFIIESIIIILVISGLLFAKKVVAEMTIEPNVSVGFFGIGGQTELLDSQSVELIEIPLAVKLQSAKFHYGVKFNYREIQADNLKRQGLGDAIISLGYQANKAFQISLKEKIPMTKKLGLSTGVNDTSLQIDFNSALIDAKQRLFATIGYTFTEQSTDVKLQNRSYVSLGTRYQLQSKVQIGVSLNYKENIFTHLDDQMGLQATIHQPLTNNYSLSAFAGYDNTQTRSIGVSLNGQF